MSAEAIIGAITEAGIVGLGGAGFPSGVKLSPKNPQDIASPAEHLNYKAYLHPHL